MNTYLHCKQFLSSLSLTRETPTDKDFSKPFSQTDSNYRVLAITFQILRLNLEIEKYRFSNGENWGSKNLLKQG